MKIPEQLVSERLIIRPFVLDDFEAFLDFLSDRDATRFLTFTPEQKTPEGAKAYFDSVIESYETYHPIFSLAIVQKEDGTYTGSCGLSPLEDGSGVECYYVLLPAYWGRGYAAEALTALFGYAFSELRIDKITARIHPDNSSSLKVANSMGMECRGNVYDSRISAEMGLFLIRENVYHKKLAEKDRRG
jgi:ribosomal-protein-alanine N-acetyltransferase